MTLEVGMYVRTRDGIVKINYSINQGVGLTFIDGVPRQDSDILKSSFNLIDLIEVGDIVHIQEYCIDWCCYKENYTILIYSYYYNENDKLVIYDDLGNSHILYNYKITSILTHEQYEANCYKVVE